MKGISLVSDSSEMSSIKAVTTAAITVQRWLGTLKHKAIALINKE